jgi:hypothetical protein
LLYQALLKQNILIQYDELTLQVYYSNGGKEVIPMEKKEKKKYEKPQIIEHGPVKDVTHMVAISPS